MRLIDADALFNWCRFKLSDAVKYGNKDAEQQGFSYGTLMMYEIAYEIDEAPTIDAVPVVRGEWVMDTDPDDGDCRCSNCHICIDALHRRNHPTLKALGYKLHTFYKYCPNCGAKMEEVE